MASAFNVTAHLPGLGQRRLSGFWLLLLLRTCLASGLEWQIDTWTTEKGLPNNTVTALAQTREGFLWVGTDNGLARFDGHQFKLYSSQNLPSFNGGRVRALCADGGGHLWVATVEPGLTRIDSQNFGFANPEPGTGFDGIVSLVVDRQDFVWYGNSQGCVGRLGPNGAQVVYTNAAANDGSLRLHAGPNGSVFVSGKGGLWKLWPGVVGEPLHTTREGLVLAASGRRGFWVSTGSTLNFLAGSNLVGIAAIPTNSLFSAKVALEDRSGNLWVGTELDGVWCLQPDGTILVFSASNGLGSDSVLSMFEDREGSIWIGTEGGGLTRLRRRLFQVLPRTDKLSSEAVSSVCEGSGGEVWIGTERNGLARLTRGPEQILRPEHGPPVRRIRALLVDSAHRLWLGTQEEGLFYYDDGGWKAFRDLLKVRQVSALFEDDRWSLWLGTGASNALYRIVGGAPQRFDVPSSSPALDIRVFASDGTGGLWFGTQGNGLFHWDGRDYRRFTHEEGLRSDTVWSLLLDPEDRSLYIGTAGGGLSRLHSGRLKSCTRDVGLFNNVICQILDDGRGWLWCSSQQGVFRVSKSELREFFDGKTNSIRSTVYGIGDGMPSLECSGGVQPAGCRTRDGCLWWPTAKGLTWIDPAIVSTDPAPPLVVMDELLVDDHTRNFALNESIETAEAGSPSVLVEPGNHRIEFRFTALSWAAPDFVTFQHRLVGLDEDWVVAGRERVVRYIGLPPGEYRFEVKAANRDGIGSPVAAALVIKIRPHPWQTWWFKASVAAALTVVALVLAIFVLRRKHQARIRRLEQLHAVEQERARIAQDIHDDLGASLTQIALLSELAQSQIEHPHAARGHLDLIFNNARKLARATDEIVWALHPKNNALELSLNFLSRFTQEYLRVAGVRCRLDIPTELPDASVPSATRHHLYLAVKEALNNIVKHSGATEVWFRLACKRTLLELTIEDNGKGFDRSSIEDSSSRRGNGLANMEQRMRSVNGSFEQTSVMGSGTITRFRVPYDDVRREP